MTLNILMICPQYHPLVGGYERAAERLSSELVTQGINVCVIAERRDLSWPASELIGGVLVRRILCVYRPHLHMLSSLLAFALFLLKRGRDFDVWHVHQYGLHAALSLALGKIFGRPVILKLTSTAGQGIGKATESLPFSLQTAAMMRRVDACVAISRETVEEAISFGIPVDRVYALGNGVDVRVFYPVSHKEKLRVRSELGVKATGVVIYVGRLSTEKNPDGLLTAWEKALSRLPANWKLVFVGNGPMEKTLTLRIRNGTFNDSVLLVGQKNDISRWMQAADIFVLPSHNEGLSNTMLEAMSSGLPIISTQVSGILETLKETGAGIVVGVNRMDELADALVTLTHDSTIRLIMGRVGRELIEEKYSIQKIAVLYLDLYRKLVFRAGKD